MAHSIRQLLDKVSNSPQTVAFWHALLEALFDKGHIVDLANLAGQAIAIHPQDTVILAYRGLAFQALGDSDSAIESFGSSLALKPRDANTLHNRAAALRGSDRAEEALADVDAALTLNPAASATMTLRAHLLADLGQPDAAVAEYQAVLKADPVNLEAHDMLARLLPQVGKREQAFDAMVAVLKALPANMALWHCALNLANDFRDGAALEALVGLASPTLRERPEFIAAKASAAGYGGDADAAFAGLEALSKALPDDASLHSAVAHWALCSGRVDAAEQHCLKATQIDAITQTAWSLLTIIWRLKCDAREEWLADYDRLVMATEVVLPDGLEAELNRLHTMQHHPSEHSLRGGTQTRGYLFEKRTPAIQALGATLVQTIGECVAKLPDDAQHPFLSRKAGSIGFSGAWSVRLRSSGFHIDHFHPQGWLSSALYIALPEEIDTEHGALAFGVPDSAFVLDLKPRRIEVPTPGKLVLFPSYMWHGTLPFESERPRLTVAFDAVPQ